MPAIEPAQVAETAEVKALLIECGLPVTDITTMSGFLVARAGGEICGTVGLEQLGEAALLRSLAVRRQQRNQRLGQRLCDEALATARKEGVKTVYLLTTDATKFFRKLGFDEVARDAAPASVRATTQFASLCPASATLMSREP